MVYIKNAIDSAESIASNEKKMTVNNGMIITQASEADAAPQREPDKARIAKCDEIIPSATVTYIITQKHQKVKIVLEYLKKIYQ